MCGEQGFITVHQTVHLVVNKFIGKGCSIFFANAYVTLLSTTGYKILIKVFVPDSFALPAWPHNSRVNVYNFRFVLIRGTQRQLLENICSEDDLRSRIFGTFVLKFLGDMDTSKTTVKRTKKNTHDTSRGKLPF